jgi:hypothetical protein
MLNHTQELNLDKQYINTQWLQTWYGIKMSEQRNYLKLDDDSIAQIGHQLFFNQSSLPDEESALLGAHKTEKLIIIGMEKSLYLLTLEGQLIEKLDAGKNLPVPVSRMGLSDIKTDSGQLIIEVENKLYSSRDDFITWTETQSKTFYPFSSGESNTADNDFYRRTYLGNELILERVVLDLHSGRLLGSFGLYLMDLTAILLLMLGLSGTWIWSRRLRKNIDFLFLYNIKLN